jgi:acetyl esterase/lipase
MRSMNTTFSSLLAAWLAIAFTLSLPAQQPGSGAQQGTAPPPQPAAGAVAVQADVPYASINGAELRLDIYQPAARGNAIRPAVVLIHGGGWTSLDKSTMRGMGQFLARSGFVAFAVDYRLLQGSQNRWPAQLDDVQRAVRWVRANAAKYGVNPDRIGAFGHSAGAQLAALLGMEETRDNSDPALAKYSSRVQAVVEVSGPVDFTTREYDPEGREFMAGFLGGDYSKHPEVWREASPAFHVSKDNAPFLIVHGTKDEEVRFTQAQELYEKLQAAGVPVSFVKVDEGHTFQTPDARRQLALQSLAFFQRYLVAPQ